MIPVGLSQRNILFPDPMPASAKINKTVLIFITRVFWLRDQNKTSLTGFTNFFDEQDKTGGEPINKRFLDFGFSLFQINFNNVLE